MFKLEDAKTSSSPNSCTTSDNETKLSQPFRNDDSFDMQTDRNFNSIPYRRSETWALLPAGPYLLQVPYMSSIGKITIDDCPG